MTTCRGCRGRDLVPVLEMDPMPLAGWFPADRDTAVNATRYPLVWLECQTCRLVNVDPDIPDDLIYRTYSYAASSVPALVRHHDRFAELLRRRYNRPRLLEIGCNDGVLLRHLPSSWGLVGVDPSDVAAAHVGNWTLVNEPFTAELAGHLGWFDVVTASNSLAHFSGLADALDGIRRVLVHGGDLWIEVHDLDATLASGQWDTIYHEHKVEWSARSLMAVVEPLGFLLRSLDRLPLHGGLLRARFERIGRYGERMHYRGSDFEALARAYRERRPPALPPRSVAYGAAARASVYLNQMPDLGLLYIVDDSPLRHDRFVAGVGLPVYPPEQFDADAPAAALITAWNHAADIKARHPDWAGEWLTTW